jgi:3-deoxy-D-manno-octulosonic-acid transferase
MFAVYRYLPLPVYLLLRVIHVICPFLRRTLGPRLGLVLPAEKGTPLYWFHASSVGEMSTIAPVVTEVLRRDSDCSVVVSTMTAGGQRRAREILESAEVFLLPIDFYPAMRRMLDGLRPAALVIGETELWPNLISEAKKQGVRLAILNGRISRKSYPRYRMIRPLMEIVLRMFDRLLMRTEMDAERITGLGADPAHVEVAGNTKYDILPGPLPEARRRETREGLGVEAGRKVVTLGSAREGECEIVLGSLRAMGAESRPLLIVAPRHMALVSQVEELVAGFGLKSVTTPARSEASLPYGADPDVIIIAEMGRLLDMYAISDIAIVGGTFKPFGGHNPLESASQGVVTIVGPNIQNIEDDIEYLRSRDCAFITDESGLGRTVTGILSDSKQRREMGLRAAAAVEAMKGISSKCVDIMVKGGILE